MPSIQQNRYYNDPALGAAFSSLAQAFAPPSGSDMAGYAAASAKKAEAQRLADLFANAQSPDFNQAVFDRMGQAAGAWTPATGYYGVDTNAATARRGQDITASTALSTNSADNARALEQTLIGDRTNRRGQDITANTSLTNNAADNTRALATNAADNTRALEQTRLGNTKDITTALIAPVSKDATRFVPPSIADMYGVPATQTGVIGASEGERIVTPDGREVMGTPKQLSDEQVKGAILQQLPASDQRRVTMQGVPVEQVIMGGKPQIVYRTDAADAGQRPFEPTADKSLIEGTAVVGNKSVQVFRKPNESSYFTADGRAVRADVQVFDKAKPTGTNEQLGMKPTEFTTKNGMFGVRADAANSMLNELEAGGYTPSALDFEMSAGVGQSNLPASVSNAAVSEQGKQFYNASQNFILSIARPDTGAAIGNQEMDNFFKIYIPMPGDDDTTKANKRQARELATTALYANSAGAADQTLQYMAAHGLEVPEEMKAKLDRIRSGKEAAAGNPAPAQPSAVGADPLAAARDAIARGAPRDKVLQRLTENGIDPKGL